jgi:Zn-dependent protease with chaperone function
MGGSRGWCSITALRGFSRIVGGVDSKRYILGLHSIAGRDPDGRATHQRFIRQLVELALYALRNLFLRSRETAAPPAYLAFAIGPEVLAIAVQELDARSDENALREAAPLFNDGLIASRSGAARVRWAIFHPGHNKSLIMSPFAIRPNAALPTRPQSRDRLQLAPSTWGAS